MTKRFRVPKFMSVFLLLLAAAVPVTADDAFFHLSLGDLELTEGSLPTTDDANWSRWRAARDKPAYALLDGDGEVYVTYDFSTRRDAGRNETGLWREIAVRVAKAGDVTGRIFLPKWDGKGMQVATFKIRASQSDAEDREKFFETKSAYYENLLRLRVPGAAWFRHQARQARKALGRDPQDVAATPAGRPRTRELADTYALFSGGRAMSENLQLDRVLQPAAGGSEMVSMDSIRGITIREIDWDSQVKGLDPELDPLASKIPADQHAVFFPSFEAMVAVSDEMAQQGAPILQLAEPRSTSARAFERYQQQLCLGLTAMARLFGPTMVKSVAITGSDPYYRTGTDVAVLFQSHDAAKFEQVLFAQVGMAAAKNKKARKIKGKVEGLSYRGFRSEDRSTCSYVATMDDIVIVTNSPFQLEQYVQVATGKAPALGSLEEFVFFRDRYRRGDEGESAFLFLSDATIRRWCGPHWRIATSRRTRDAAVVAELQAGQLDRLVGGKVKTGPLYTELPVGGDDEITLTPTGVQGSTIGSLAFMTPISEMRMDRVTKAEADAYTRWRDRYQSNWRWAFDPIGLRLKIEKNRVAADLTVMPLIWGSDYREIISYSQGADFEPGDGDLHDTVAHVIMAINTESPELRRQTSMLQTLVQGMMPSAKIEPLSWLGDNVGVYVDDDPFWDELAKVPTDEADEFLEEKGWKIPVAVRAEVSSGLKLTLFLGAVRAFIEQASPGMLNWENLDYKDQPYVKITPTERAIGTNEEVRNVAIYYIASGKSLTLTPNEGVLKRAIDRDVEQMLAKKEGRELPAVEHAWLGSSLGLHVDETILKVIGSLSRESYQRTMQNRAWGNLVILNEWKRRFSDKDPVELHEQFWQERLLCPGGGEYVWNEKWQTMESTVYGCPAVPKQGPPASPLLHSLKYGNFGLTFEEQGCELVSNWSGNAVVHA